LNNVIYKFKDLQDGNYAFILAQNLEQAQKRLEQETGLKFKFVGCKSLDEIGKALVIRNDILPF